MRTEDLPSSRSWCETSKESVERVTEVFEKYLNIKRDFDMELLEHIKDEKCMLTAMSHDKFRCSVVHSRNSSSASVADRGRFGDEVPPRRRIRLTPGAREASRDRPTIF